MTAAAKLCHNTVFGVVQGEPEAMTDADWADLMDGDVKPKQPDAAESTANDKADKPRASSKAPPPGFEKPVEADQKPTAPPLSGDSKSFGGGNAALTALMGSAPLAAAAAAAAPAPAEVHGSPDLTRPCWPHL